MRIKAAEAIIKCLEAENITTVFGYPGGAVLPLYESLRKSNIKHILVRQEQSAAHMASGYGRALDKTGVCIATSGPGATNLITGIATAYMDSIPLLVITGQVNSSCIGKDMFQEADIIGATLSFTKNSYLVKDADDLPRIIKEAFYIASTGRNGPVLIDVPRDIQETSIDFKYPEEVNIRGYKPTINGNSRQIKKAADLINNAKKPLICAGGGVRSSNATDELKKLSEKTKIPLVYTLMGVDCFNSGNKYNVGLIGSHGYTYVNQILNEADLLIACGARFADRSTAMMKNGSKQNIIHIDIDPAEIGKNKETAIPVVGDIKEVLNELLSLDYSLNTDEWLSEINEKKSEFIINKKEPSGINPKRLINKISKSMGRNGIWAADVGKNQIWAALSVDINDNRQFLTTGGLGTMGYSLPAAIGAKIARPDANVVASMGDGGFQMLLGDIATAKSLNAGVKFLILNNNNLGMVRELQLNAYGAGSYYGTDLDFNPDFMQLAKAYSIDSMKITRIDEIEYAVKEMFKDDSPFILECVVDPDIPSVPHLGGRI